MTQDHAGDYEEDVTSKNPAIDLLILVHSKQDLK